MKIISAIIIAAMFIVAANAQTSRLVTSAGVCATVYEPWPGAVHVDIFWGTKTVIKALNPDHIYKRFLHDHYASEHSTSGCPLPGTERAHDRNHKSPSLGNPLEVGDELPGKTEFNGKTCTPNESFRAYGYGQLHGVPVTSDKPGCVTVPHCDP